MSILDMILGRAVFIVGVEPDPHGARVYLGARYRGRYVVVTDPHDVELITCAWRNEHHRLLVNYDQVGPPSSWLTCYDTLTRQSRGLRPPTQGGET